MYLCALLETMSMLMKCGGGGGGDGGGDGFFLACDDFGRMFDNSFSACIIFFSIVEIS